MELLQCQGNSNLLNFPEIIYLWGYLDVASLGLGIKSGINLYAHHYIDYLYSKKHFKTDFFYDCVNTFGVILIENVSNFSNSSIQPVCNKR